MLWVKWKWGPTVTNLGDNVPINLFVLIVCHGVTCWEDYLAVSDSDGACRERSTPYCGDPGSAPTSPWSPKLTSQQAFFMSLDNSLLLTPEVEDHKWQCMVMNRNRGITFLLEVKRPTRFAAVVLKEIFLCEEKEATLDQGMIQHFPKQKTQQSHGILWLKQGA